MKNPFCFVIVRPIIEVFFWFQKSDKWSKRDFFLLQMVSWLSSDSRACRWQSIIVSVQWDTRGARKKRARNEELWRRPNWGLITRSSRNSAISGSLKHASSPLYSFNEKGMRRVKRKVRGKEEKRGTCRCNGISGFTRIHSELANRPLWFISAGKINLGEIDYTSRLIF